MLLAQLPKQLEDIEQYLGELCLMSLVSLSVSRFTICSVSLLTEVSRSENSCRDNKSISVISSPGFSVAVLIRCLRNKPG